MIQRHLHDYDNYDTGHDTSDGFTMINRHVLRLVIVLNDHAHDDHDHYADEQ